MFPSLTGTGLGQGKVRKALKRALDRAGIDGHLTVHGLRHVFASLLIAQPDADPTRVSRQMGHANANITYSIYAHLFEQAKYAESARAALDASFGSSGEDLDVARAGAVAGAAAMSRRTTLPFSAGSTPAVQRWQEGSC